MGFDTAEKGPSEVLGTGIPENRYTGEPLDWYKHRPYWYILT